MSLSCDHLREGDLQRLLQTVTAPLTYGCRPDGRRRLLRASGAGREARAAHRIYFGPQVALPLNTVTLTLTMTLTDGARATMPDPTPDPNSEPDKE